MNKKTVIALATTFFSTYIPAQEKKPNVVIFYLDDMGYGDLTMTGAQGYQTPNIDRLAHDGIFMSQFYSPSAVSSASRAGLLTGCYPNRIGIFGALSPNSKVGLNPKELNIVSMLKSVGYKTAMIGKWHLGDAPQFMPINQGFEEFFGLPYSNDMWPYGYYAKRGMKPEIRNPKSPKLALYENNKVFKFIESQEDQDQLTTEYTNKAVSFIKKNNKNPFFLYIAHSMPHMPLGVSDKFRGKSEQGPYGDVMMEIDWSVGEVVKTLKEIGADKNTIVIFTSDNGPWITFGDYQGSAGGLKEAKHSSFEGGQRVPCIIKWPGIIPEGIFCNRLVCAIDILPTLANITGAKLSDNKIDGVNILPVLKGNFKTQPRKLLYYYYGNNMLRAVRNDRFKLVAPHSYASNEGQLPGKDGIPGKTPHRETDWSLYDLRRDPGERYNVIEMYPEVVESLKQALDSMRVDIGDSNTNSVGANVRQAGKASE
jgi:arylsulfatase A-like enzyme